MAHAFFLTSWPTSLGHGSGTALFVNNLKQAVERTGSTVSLLNPSLDTSDYTQFTLERFWYNVQLKDHPGLAEADWILGLDYDGFALPRRPGQPFIGTARTVFADLALTEPDPYRTMLQAQAYFEQKNLSRCDYVVVPSPYSKRKLIEHYGLDPASIHVVPNGIDLAAWRQLWDALPDPDPLRRPTVLAVSKLYPRKRIEVLIRATPLIRAAFPDVEVRIVGCGSERERLEQVSAEAGATGSITWLGDVHERRRVVAEYKRCHVFTHASIQEAFPNTCLEAMASARPVVVADAGPMPDLVNRAESGLVVPPDEPEALAEALCHLLADTALRDRLGASGATYSEGLTWAATATRFLHLLDAPLRDRADAVASEPTPHR